MDNNFRQRIKFLLWFLPLAFIIFYSCTKTDLSPVQTGDNENFVEIFFATKTPINKETANLIEVLKKQNNRTGFVLELPSNCGLPIWDKLVFPKKSQAPSFNDYELYTGNFMIPLTSNGYSISMIITGEKINDSSYTVRAFTATDLYNVCSTATDNNIKNAESLLASFIYMENIAFDRTDFYHIPKKNIPNYRRRITDRFYKTFKTKI